MFTEFVDGPAVQGAITVTTTAAEARVGGSALDERKVLAIQPNGGDIYWSYNAGITTSTGFKLYDGTLVYIQTGAELPIYLITATGSVSTIIAEVA